MNKNYQLKFVSVQLFFFLSYRALFGVNVHNTTICIMIMKQDSFDGRLVNGYTYAVERYGCGNKDSCNSNKRRTEKRNPSIINHDGNAGISNGYSNYYIQWYLTWLQ